MVILGLDSGQKRLGVSVVNLKTTGEISLSHAEVVYHENENNLKFNKYLNEGIYQLCDKFPLLLHIHCPDIIVAEIIPVGRLGSNTELNVAAITVCKVWAWQWGIDWFDIAANSVKKIVTGDGRATKAKVKHEVINRFENLIALEETYKKSLKNEGKKVTGFPPDLYDAVAIGVAGAELQRKEQLVTEAEESVEDDDDIYIEENDEQAEY